MGHGGGGSRIQRGLQVGLGEGEAFDDNPCGLKVRDAVVGAVAHEDGLTEEGDQWAGLVGEEAAGGLFEVDDEVVGHVAFGAEDRRLKRAMERGDGELAYGVGAGADGCNGQGHLFCRLPLGFSAVSGWGGTKI